MALFVKSSYPIEVMLSYQKHDLCSQPRQSGQRWKKEEEDEHA